VLLAHSARGYSWLEGQATRRFVPGATVSGFKGGVRLRCSDDENYVECYIDDTGTNSRLRIDVVVGGVRANRATTNLGIRIADGEDFWVRGRVEGDVVYAEYFDDDFASFTVEPTPLESAPDATREYTLTGGEEDLPAGRMGASWVPKAADARIGAWRDEPFVRFAQPLPGHTSWADAIPGDADALMDVHVTHEGGATSPTWAMLGWTPTPGVSFDGLPVPFGVIRAESADSLTTWAVTADGDYRGGSGLQATAAGAGSAGARYDVDPATLAPDPFTMGELELEFWVRVELASTLVSPKLTLSATPFTASGVAQVRYTGEWGSQGKLLVLPSSGTRFRMVRLGALTVLSDPVRPVQWRVTVDGSWAAGSSGVFGLDDLYVVAAAARAAGPTGRPFDASYPRFLKTTGEATKIVRSDLSGEFVEPRRTRNPAPDVGLGGSLIEPPAGKLETLVVLSSLVPDDPSATADTEQEDHTATVHLSVWPRTRFVRGS
jgi:hypothetical protein